MNTKLTDLPEYAALRDAYSVEKLLKVVYDGDDRATVGPMLTKLAEAGSTTIADYVERLGDYTSDFDRLIYLLVSVRSVIGERQWIHFELAGLHHNFVLMGLKPARSARYIHASLALEGGKLNEVASAMMHGMMAEALIVASPADALHQGAQAVRYGYLVKTAITQEAMAAVPAEHRKQLNETYGDVMPKPEAAPGKAKRPVGVTVRSTTAASVVSFPVPAKDGDHYIFEKHELVSPGIDVLIVKDALLSVDIRRPGMTEFYVHDKNGTFLPQISRGQVPFLAPEPIRFRETVGLLDDWFSEMNICHFLLDKIPRLDLFDQTKLKYRPMLFRQNGYYDQVFADLGMKQGPLCADRDYFTARIDTLLVSTGNATTFCHPAQWFPDWAKAFLKRRFAPSLAKGDRRIFISRADAKTRRILNQAEVDGVLAEFNYESCELTGRTFADQRALFAQASHVVGVHGAGLTNILFAPTGTQVLEILPPMCAVPDYWQLSNALGHQYHAAIATDPDFPKPDYDGWVHNAALNMRDVVLDLDLLRERLTEMDAAAR